jgi:ribosomal protection tetracycline resistance protein
VATLNLGILAHVDAGKTTLTERLLHAAGVIDEVGRVDDGTTQTDSLVLERQRGITIKSAVVSFVVGGVTINLLDTPGHPDFIAEVERVLGVLDGAVLVVSAVEGVQSQTLLLFRALRRLRVPTLVFVNKIDRVGADDRQVLAAVAERFAVNVLAMGTPRDVGTKRAAFTVHGLDEPSFSEATTELLAANDDTILRRYLDETPMAPGHVRQALAEQTAQLHVVPVYFGAALTGVGVEDLLHAIPTLLPAAEGDTTGAGSGTVFKIERGPSREKVAFVRVFSGTLRTRDRIRLGADASDVETVTAIEVFDRGTTRRRPATRAGEIAKVHGLTTARIGDTFGPTAHTVEQHAFSRPTLETAIVPRHSGEKRAVFDALSDLAEQDPLINLRQDDTRQELFLSLYGEVQKEVVAQTLHGDYGLDIEFRPTTPVCVERPNRAGAAVELLPRRRSPAHPFLATVGLAISPPPPNSGVTFELDVSIKSIPIHVFDSVDAFRDVMQRTVHETLRQGIHGWEVTDCRVIMTDCDYQAPPRKWPGTTLWDYRLLTPLVLMAALKQAGTTVLEPVLEFHMELPAADLGPIMSVLSELEAQPGSPNTHGSTSVLEGVIRVARLHHLQSRLPELTRGEGVLESTFAGYRPVQGLPPARPRTDRNPLDRADYLRRINRSV